MHTLFLGWKHWQIDDQEDRHRRWQGIVELKRVGNHLDDHATLQIALLDSPAVDVDRTGWPW